MNKIILSILALISITAISEGSAYAQTDHDVLQVWKQYVESYKEYMEEYKQWAYDRFENYEAKIILLDNENSKYEDKITSLENDILNLKNEISGLKKLQTIPEPTTKPTPEPTTKPTPGTTADPTPGTTADPTAETTQDPGWIQINPLETNYEEGDTLIISGIINNVYAGTPLSIRINNSDGDLVSISQINIDSNGEFSSNILLDISTRAMPSGTSTIVLQYGSEKRVTTKTFNYQTTTTADPIKTYHENGNLESETQYYESEKPEWEKWYYPTGELEYEIQYNENENEKWYRSYMIGNDIKQREAQNIENEKGYYRTGELKTDEQYNENGKLEFTKEYYKNGNLESETQHYENGEKKFTQTWYTNGQLRYDIHYDEDGNKSRKTYNHNGILIYERNNHFEKDYYQNGNLRTEKQYYEHGIIKWKKDYSGNGDLKHEQYYDIDGIEIEK